MATETTNIKLKIIEDKDTFSQDLINVNTELIETELTKARATAEAVDASIETLQSYVDTNFYTKTQADAKFLAVSAYKDTRVVTFTGSNIEVRYPWEGTAKQIQINSKATLSAAFIFQVERQSQADYAAQTGNWEKVGAITLSLAAGSVYLEQAITHAIHAGDILRYTTTAANDTDITVQLIIENTIILGGE